MSVSLLAAVQGSYIFLGFLGVMFFAIAFGYFSRRGSGINQRPHDGRGGAEGAQGPSSISTTEDDVERTVGTHGTR
jgi:hypothetical protein